MIFIPELNYHLYENIYGGTLNKKHFKVPIKTNSSWSVTNSVFNLLFNETFSAPNYSYKFSELNFTELDDMDLKRRLSLHIVNLEIYVISDSTEATNVFMFDDEELELLDRLYDFRLNDVVHIESITYEELESNFSKLLYIYLSYMNDGDFSLYNTNELICNNSRFIEIVFEKYLIDKMFSTTTLNNYTE